jgi:hypothetical protein
VSPHHHDLRERSAEVDAGGPVVVHLGIEQAAVKPRRRYRRRGTRRAAGRRLRVVRVFGRLFRRLRRRNLPKILLRSVLMIILIVVSGWLDVRRAQHAAVCATALKHRRRK